MGRIRDAWGALFESRARTEGPYSMNDAGTVTIFDSRENTPSGVAVTEHTALAYSAVYACVRIIGESIASLPLVLYRRRGEHRERAVNHPLYELLHDQPNPYMTSLVFREAAMAHLLLWGNHYSEIERDGKGQVKALTPLLPQNVCPEYIEATGRIVYRVSSSSGQDRILNASQVFHLPGLSFNGIVGLSVIEANRETIGLGIAANRLGGSFFGNGAKPSGILTSKTALKPETRKKLLEQWNAANQGVRNAGKTVVLDAEMGYTQLSINPNDAQFLESRKFQVEEIARIFRVPLVMLQSTEKSTTWGSGIEHLHLGFATYTLRPWLVRIEQEIRRKLLLKSEQGEFYAEHLLDALVRADLTARYAAYQIGLGGTAPFLTVDEVRRMENLDPLGAP